MQDTHKEMNKDASSVLLQDILFEKRRERRWKNIRFVAWFLLFAYTIVSIFHLIKGPGPSLPGNSEKTNYVSLVRLDGMIAPGRDFSAENILPILHDAFSDKTAKGVVIVMNSPGGTPVQSALIHDAILYLKKKYHKKIIVVGEDLLTSGAYYVAVSADKIYVNANTLTGSIGVIMKGFGFVDLIKKVGVERRVYVSGDNKDRLDPFLPQSPADVEKIKQVTGEVHANFSQAVLEGRKGKLKADPQTLFTGDFWSGQTAVKLGLVDGLGDVTSVSEKEFNTTHYKEYGGTPGFLRLISGQLNSTFDTLFYTYA